MHPKYGMITELSPSEEIMKYITLLFIFISSYSTAAGWATAAVPTRVDVVRDDGFMIYGAFGNAGGCTIENRVLVQKSHPQYSEIYSLALAAVMAEKRVQPHISGCKTNGWYVTSEKTFNIMAPSDALNVFGS